jgi:putative SOS response-associated peptidase YedK
MCNRFRSTQREPLEEHFQAWDEIEHQPRFNIAPSQPVLTVRQLQGKRKMSMMRWGLIPPWDSSITNGNFNVRSETVTHTLAFRDAIHDRRCLIPADGFYEWRTMGNVRQPYCFEVGNGKLFAFAGLWDEWKKPTGEIIESCTILTTEANSLVAEIHDRMPVIIAPEHYDLWLSDNPKKLDEALAVMKPCDPAKMRRYPVSTKLNYAENDDAESAREIVFDLPTQTSLFR